MLDGYPLRKYDWKDWLLMIVASSLILQVIMIFVFSRFAIPSPSQLSTSGMSEEFLQIIINHGVVYGTILSLPLTLFVIYKRKIPLFNRKGLSQKESFIIRGLTKKDWKFLVKYIPVSYILYTGGSIIVEKFFGASEAANQVAVESLFDHIPMWQLFLMIVIVAPITEELLFRGIILFPGNQLNTTWMRMIVSALIFGLIHTTTDIDVYTLYTYIGMGIIFTYAAKRTNSIEASIIYHFLNNLMGFFAILSIK